ncbi:MAG: T9SS type A sorting domain-containing protein [Bacteroidota bacterium]
MRKYIGILILFFIFNVIQAQSWGSIISTITTTGQGQVLVASTVDKQGVHVLYKDGSYMKYGLLSSTGTVIRSGINVVSSAGSFYSMAALDGKIFLAYQSSNNLSVARSTDGGASWNTNYISRALSGSAMLSLTSAIDSRGFHVAWSDNASSYKTYYARVDLSDGTNWYDYKDVTDVSGETGTNPSIALSSNKVHIAYTSGASAATKTRDFTISTNSWESTPETVPYYPYYIYDQKIVAMGNNLHAIYRGYISGYGGTTRKLMHFVRDINSTSWSSSGTFIDYWDQYQDAPQLLKTLDNKLHLFYGKPGDNGGCQHLIFDGSTWSTNQAPSSFGDLNSTTFSAVGNDLFYTSLYSVDFSIKYSQYDAAPIAAQNSLASVVNVSGENYPKITWSLNPEPDVYPNSSGYEVWRRDDNTGSGNWSQWVLKGTVSGSTSIYIDYQIPGAGFGPKHHEYKVRAQDIASNLGNYSSVVAIKSGTNIQKHGVDFRKANPEQFSLNQNYPNPFNPTTMIDYEVPEESYVTITVFDHLGKEVASLVNQVHTGGFYSASFDAGSLASGVYYYRINAGKFSETKKMILMK